MQDNDGWELVGYEFAYLDGSRMEKVPKWVVRKMQSMDLRHIAHAGDGKVQHFYPLRGRRYNYRIYADPCTGSWSAAYVYRKPRDRSRHRRRGSSKALVGALVVAGAVLLRFSWHRFSRALQGPRFSHCHGVAIALSRW